MSQTDETGATFRAFVRERFAGGTGWTMSSVRRDVTLRGDVAWFDEDLRHAKYGALRGSGVAARGADGAWRIEHYDPRGCEETPRPRAARRNARGEAQGRGVSSQPLGVTVPNERFEAVAAAIARGASA